MKKSILRAEARALSGKGAVLHAAAISLDGKGLLLIAPSGGGKSTAASLLSAAGHGVIGDDSVIVSRGTEGTWRLMPCASWVWSTGESPSPVPLKWTVFLEKGLPEDLIQLNPVYAAWRLLTYNKPMAYMDLPPIDRSPFREQVRVLFREFPVFILRHGSSRGLLEMLGRLP